MAAQKNRTLNKVMETKRISEIVQELQNRIAKAGEEGEYRANDIKRMIGKELGMSLSVVQRYLRLTYLNEDLLHLADKELLCVYAGYELSFISQEEQKVIADYIRDSGEAFSRQQAEILKKLSFKQRINNEVLEALIPDNSVEVAVVRTNLDEMTEKEILQSELAMEVRLIIGQWKQMA